MERGRLNYWVDVLLLICFVVLVVTGIILFFVFVSGEPGAGRKISFLGEAKMFWLTRHSYFGLAVVVLAGVHLVLHFNWLVSMTKNMFSKA